MNSFNRFLISSVDFASLHNCHHYLQDHHRHHHPRPIVITTDLSPTPTPPLSTPSFLSIQYIHFVTIIIITRICKPGIWVDRRTFMQANLKISSHLLIFTKYQREKVINTGAGKFLELLPFKLQQPQFQFYNSRP